MLGVRVIHLEVTMVGDWKVGFCHLNMWWIANVGCAKFKGLSLAPSLFQKWMMGTFEGNPYICNDR